MYRRFLNNGDYIGIITEQALNDLIRGNEDRLSQAEEAAEASVIEYLTDNYEIEKTLATGKNIMEYNRQITYPAGSYFHRDGKIWETMRPVNGVKAPAAIPYWEEFPNAIEEGFSIEPYSQLKNYKPDDVVSFSNGYYICVEYNGIDFNNIRLPGVSFWAKIQAWDWAANFEYEAWDAVLWDGKYYALISMDNLDLTVNPYDSNNWGMIGDYDPNYNEYGNIPVDYVVYEGSVYLPVMHVNSDELKEGFNIRQRDPRNANVKKHILRLALYELHKLISPNNVSSARITDYETSIMWLRDASKLKLNPQIPRKLDEERKPVAEYAIATFQRDYDPHKNPWQI
jgi:hypothetical protein